MSHANDIASIFGALKHKADLAAGHGLDDHTPIDGSRLARIAVSEHEFWRIS